MKMRIYKKTRVYQGTTKQQHSPQPELNFQLHGILEKGLRSMAMVL